MARPVLVQRLLYFSLAVLLAVVVYGTLYVSSLALLLLLPPSLTYYMLDAVRDARHQKVLLAQLSDAELEAYLRSIELIPYTGSTVVDRDRLLAEIADIRRTGVGRAFGEYAAGVIAIAVALPRSGATPGAINVAVPESRYNAELDRAIVAQLQAACRALRTETA